MSKKEVDRVFDDIVDFSELEEFIDGPVKFYSSGMYVRLGFAVAVNVDPDILVIDEVLAVGDERFQRKCIDRVKFFQREGRTILLVTHSPDQVRAINEMRVQQDASQATPLVDWNQDNCIDFNEFSGNMLSLFDTMDTNSDGQLSPDELKAGGARPPGQGTPPGTGGRGHGRHHGGGTGGGMGGGQ